MSDDPFAQTPEPAPRSAELSRILAVKRRQGVDGQWRLEIDFDPPLTLELLLSLICTMQDESSGTRRGYSVTQVCDRTERRVVLVLAPGPVDPRELTEPLGQLCELAHGGLTRSLPLS